MKVGIFLTCQHPPGSDMIAALEGQYAMARLARDRGWDAVATGQHYLSEGVRQLQLVPFLARLAAEAGEMTGIAGVLLTTLHNPVEVAECIASLDAIWRGNFVFGVGLGYRDVEFDAFGVPRGQRVRRFEQCLEVVKRLWTEDNVSFENDICKLTCRPIQHPHPPIWFAANNDRAVRRAARLGDSWFVNPHATIPEITRQLTLYRDELARLEKPFPAILPYAREIYCAKDTPTALAMAGPYLAEKYRTYATWGQDEVLPGNDSFRQPFEALLRNRFVLGSPEECYEQLRPCWEEAEANFLIFRTHWSGMPVGHALASMRLISDELLPALRRITPPPSTG
jgi:alkanesulfonate monooxygenase SsuD/methylene tetrahydromethanopterin reductase-like flavin-dependent oxidoreductase (luciferase family)